MILGGFLLFIFIAVIIGFGLRMDYSFNYRTKEGNTVFGTSIDYMKDHEFWYVLWAVVFIVAIVFLAI